MLALSLNHYDFKCSFEHYVKHKRFTQCILKYESYFSSGVAKWDLKEETEEYWRESARDEIQKRIEQSQNINMSKAKNTVLLIGDGMGITTMTAGRILIDGENHMTQEDYRKCIRTNKSLKGP